ncbi:nucleotidyltransferase domain-containing protein [Streptomyces sp. NPDC050560]|uniref:nucleotidyltransferase domain-containing protein n=1 Tax=Streptomyces sp. NPDC050560 TaxID=3365630 RepID=UPI0037A4D1F7
MLSGDGGRPAPRDAARGAALRLHPDARAVVLGGSVLTSARTAYSDLDLVVLLDGAPAPYRLSLAEAGWPVEVFAHTVESWRGFVDRETARRRSPLLFLCARGELVHDRDGCGAALVAEARQRVAAGPRPIGAYELEPYRYALTDLLDDLRGCVDPAERTFVAAEIARRTAELAVLVRGGWVGTGKWAARRLREVAPETLREMEAAVRACLGDEDPHPLLDVAGAVLDEAGGPLWEGFRRAGDVAPAP